MTNLLQKLKQLHPLYLITPIAFVVASSYVITVMNTTKAYIEHIIDYTNCINDSNKTTTCKDYTKNGRETCVCLIEFNLTENFDGKIIAYYELPLFNQLQADYVNSKDDNQLQGVLNSTPSVNCEPYRYDENGRPIAPCGLIADTLFNDTFNIRETSSDKYVPYVMSGMLADHEKKKYRNPDNITEAELNFAKPRNWIKTIWKLDKGNSDNNGFQNELFMGWMNTELKRKPRCRITQQLPNGSYVLRVGFNYPTSVYDGPRKYILTSFNDEYRRNPLIEWIWIISLVAISLYIISCLIIYIKNKIQQRKKEDASNDQNNENTTSLM